MSSIKVKHQYIRYGVQVLLRMYCIDRARVPESHDAHAFYCLYD